MELDIRKTRHGHWIGRRAALALPLVVVGVIATLDAWKDLLYLALRDEEAQHALLVPLIALWLFIVRRGRLRHARPVGLWVGPLLVAGGWLAYTVGDRELWQIVWHFGAICVLVGCLITTLGRDVLLRTAPAFAALLFMLPLPGRIRQEIAIPLQTVTAEVTQNILVFLGIGVERAGNLLSVNGVEVAVAEACSGMRMTVSLLLVMFTFAFVTPMHNYVRVLLLVCSPIFAITCNVIRLLPTVWIYGHASNETADLFHDVSGWVMLFVAFFLLMGVVRLLEWAMVPVGPHRLAID